MSYTIEQVAADIKRAYEATTGDEPGWLKMVQLADVLWLDVSADVFAQAIRHLVYHDTEWEWEVMPESNKKTLKAMDLIYSVRLAGQDNDLIKRFPK